MTENNLVTKKLQVQVASQSGSKTVIKNINLNKIVLTATDDELYAAGKAVSELQTLPLNAIRTISTNDLSESA